MSILDAAVTQWFPKLTKPPVPGVYEVEPPIVIKAIKPFRWFAYFDGVKFGYRTCVSPQAAFEDRNEETALPPDVKWRGLAGSAA